MPFPWKRYPAALHMVFQYIEDHAAFRGSEQEFDGIITLMKSKFGADSCQGLKATAIRQKLSTSMHEYLRDDSHGVKDLYRLGVRVMDLADYGRRFKLNKARTTKVSSTSTALQQAQSDAPPSSTQQLPANHEQEVESPKSKKRPLQDFEAGCTSEVAGLQAKRKKTSIISSTTQKRRSEDLDLTETIPSKRVKFTHGADQGRPSHVNTHTSNASDDLNTGLAAHTDTDSTLSNDSSSVTASKPEEETRQDPPPSKITPADLVPSKENEKELDHDEDRDKTTGSKDNTRWGKILLKLANPTPTREFPQARTKTPLEDLVHEEGHGSPVDDDDGYARAHPNTSGLPYPTSKIEKAMRTLAEMIDETVTIEFEQMEKNGQFVDKAQPFRLDVKNFDDDGRRIIKKIFGDHWSWKQLQARINEAQIGRRLKLRTFIESFIGASVTMHALEPHPLGELNKRSTEYRLYKQLLRTIKCQETEKHGSDVSGQHYTEFMRLEAIQNHILQDVLPTIDGRSTELAFDLRSQIHALFPAGDESGWNCWRGLLRAVGPASISNEEDPPLSSYPVKESAAGPPREDRLFSNLKKIFKEALTKRAEWEAAGEAIYWFHFQIFDNEFDPDIQQANDEGLDRDKTYKVFVSIIPSVWAQNRDNKDSKWQRKKCISKNVVFLKDPRTASSAGSHNTI